MNRKYVILAGFVILIFVVASLLCYQSFTQGILDDYGPEKAEQLRTWALQIIERHSADVSATNEPVRIGGAVPTEFALKAPYSGWSLVVYPATTNSPRHLGLQSLGGFASMEIVVGPTNLHLPTNRFCEQQAAGVYISRTGNP
jgi:hypothetical protein